MFVSPLSIAVPRASLFSGIGDEHHAPNDIAVGNAVDRVMDLSLENRNVFTSLDGLSGEERDSFLDLLAGLLKQGIVGIETLDVRGRPYERFATNSIGDDRFRGAKDHLARNRDRLDLRA